MSRGCFFVCCTAHAAADMPVKTIPIFLHLQGVLAPLPIPQPPVLMTSSSSSTAAAAHPEHMSFIMTLHDPTHSLRFCTVTQPVPGDWLDVEYENSDWVEERLVDVLRVGVEIIAQDVSHTFLEHVARIVAHDTVDPC